LKDVSRSPSTPAAKNVSRNPSTSSTTPAVSRSSTPAIDPSKLVRILKIRLPLSMTLEKPRETLAAPVIQQKEYSSEHKGDF
jgi:hypothetical protein